MDGRLVKTEKVDTLIDQQIKRLDMRFREKPSPDEFAIDGVTILKQEEKLITFEVEGNLDLLMKQAVHFGICDIETVPVSLEEIFLALYGRDKGRDLR
jgi:ABC-2 type transport system ATP-binding protein